MAKPQEPPLEAAPETFETWLQELETVVDDMEGGELTLERSLALFERGIALSDQCQKALNDAEQKVQILTKPAADAELEPFDDEA